MSDVLATVTTLGSIHRESDQSPEERRIEHLHDELERVSYALSHDMLAVLRIMEGPRDVLRKTCDVSGSEEQEACNALQQHIDQLKTMFKGLQEYIRLETFPVVHVALDANELLQTALEVLSDPIRQTGAKITYDTLPKIKGHRGRLNHLFIYLIENAVKFHGAEAPRVHVSASQAGDAWVFSIRDNGIGIDEDGQDMMFRLFHRLKPDKYPGCGIGLALSRKIVASHGGELTVKSAPGEGSAFSFTLPAAP